MLSGQVTKSSSPVARRVRLPVTVYALSLASSTPSSSSPITVVCLSDTHGTQPPLPPGDLLLHAGDLTEWGTFTEIQEQLTWLSQQPHKHKVIIAGNHDLLLDEVFRHQNPEKWKQALKAVSKGNEEEEELKTLKDLDWENIVYLQNTSATLVLHDGKRTLTIFGSPHTPRHGLSAFQHPAHEDVWTGAVPPGTDIILTHGPPRGHLDGVKKSGCTFLAQEATRVPPRLVVFGHIHIGYGIEDRVYDSVGKAYEGIIGGQKGWGSLLGMLGGVLLGRLLSQRLRQQLRRTTFVNAAIVEGWEDYKIKNEAVVLII